MNKQFDPQWVTLAQKGDQNSITELYSSAWQEVSIVIKTMIRTDNDTVQDLVQDTFLKTFNRLEQLDDPAKYHAWIKQIARNTALDYLKKSKAILFSELYDDDIIPIEIEDEDLAHLPDVALDKQESARLLREILDSLPEMQRTVISMHYLQEIPIKDIASMLDRSENTIKVHLHKGRKNLEQKILALEQKEDIRLYSLSPLPFLLLLLRNMDFQPDMSMLGNILESATTAGSAAAGTATGSAAKAAGGIAVKKIAASILTAATLAGGIAVYSSVTKLPEYPKKDLFAEDFRVEFIGENGVGVANVYCMDGYGLDYDVEPSSALSNGEVVTLTLSAPNGDILEDYCEEHYGFTPTTDSCEYVVDSLAEAATEPTEALYNYEQLVADYISIISGEIPIDQAGIDLSQSALWVTPYGCTINDEGYFTTSGTIRFSFVQTDLDEDGIDELISLEEYKVGNMEWDGTILDIFTLKDGKPNWLIAGAYRGYVDIFEDGIIRQWCDGGSHYYEVNFYTIQDGELVLVNTTAEEDYVFTIKGEVSTEAEFLAEVDQYVPRLATDMERIVIIEP